MKSNILSFARDFVVGLGNKFIELIIVKGMLLAAEQIPFYAGSNPTPAVCFITGVCKP